MDFLGLSTWAFSPGASYLVNTDHLRAVLCQRNTDAKLSSLLIESLRSSRLSVSLSQAAYVFSR